jgi:hypothetical protein
MVLVMTSDWFILPLLKVFLESEAAHSHRFRKLNHSLRPLTLALLDGTLLAGASLRTLMPITI